MKSNDAILVALLVVLILIVAYLGTKWYDKHDKGCESSDIFEGFGSSPAGSSPAAKHHYPRIELDNQLDEIRGRRNDGFRQLPAWRRNHGLDRYHQAGAYLTPEDLQEAEREQWYAASDEDTAGTDNTEMTSQNEMHSGQGHQRPSMDYVSHITDLVVDSRTRDNHRKWAEHMKPWSGTAITVDNIEELLEATTDFIGLQRPRGVSQYNPLQLTERDAYTFSSNRVLNFRDRSSTLD